MEFFIVLINRGRELLMNILKFWKLIGGIQYLYNFKNDIVYIIKLIFIFIKKNIYFFWWKDLNWKGLITNLKSFVTLVFIPVINPVRIKIWYQLLNFKV